MADEEERRRFWSLRSVRWRIDLGILPASPGASVEEHRRAAADSRRRYVSLRRRLLVDPHVPKEEGRSSNLVVDNPLSQNPDSSWGRFFRGAELEKTVDQDLSRLYPEDGSYFQTPACQAMLRRILLMWCLQHPEYGYCQGMHELLAPLVYVLQVDIDKLSQVRNLHEDCFNDDFDGVPFPDTDMVFSYKPRKDPKWNFGADNENDSEKSSKINSLDELDRDTKEIILLSDAYGAEGELGIVLSERFMEHDAYSMFDGLMDGGGGVVRMAEFFSPSTVGSSSSLPPVIEASSALYHLLSIVEPTLHNHFIELKVEPQWFALRWLRVLFGREFCLNDLLVVWDKVFSCTNNMLLSSDEEYNFRILCSARGAFIAAMAMSMLLHIRSSLLATELDTVCLRRLLNFPTNIDVQKLIEKACSLQSIAIDANTSSSSFLLKRDSCDFERVHGNPGTSTPPRTPLHPVSESYWEEKWRNAHKDGTPPKEVEKGNSFSKQLKKSLTQRLGLSRTESDPSPVKVLSVSNDTRSDPSPAKVLSASKNNRNSVRRCLLNTLSDDLERSNEIAGKIKEDEFPTVSVHREHPLSSAEPSKLKAVGENVTASPSRVPKVSPLKTSEVETVHENTTQGAKRVPEACSSGENSPVFYAASSGNDPENSQDTDSESSSVTSKSCAGDHDRDEILKDEPSSCNDDNKTIHDSEAASSDKSPDRDGTSEKAVVSNERKPLIAKFQWLLKLGRPQVEGNMEKSSGETLGDKQDVDTSCSSPLDGNSNNSRGSGKLAPGDKKVVGTLKNIGQNMLENIQVIESAFQQDRGQPGPVENFSNNILGGKGQVTAMAALTELRKISNLLSEM
ncbi:LOW QUALITY PROTEIN: TBC1 domain family member 5 homolog A [Oryza brachyantha]|uniref:Rab-GAP TBC domain-containing protein n=1 Tax=Oryza brachyantha TaxID=4533 RepID=J3MUG4_ORYBR|nr:LOW QUALITY PROTEIN: TBC1 domain family member 5 homolog A [Oryza brachyantha]